MITQFQKGATAPVEYPCVYSEVPWSTQMINVCDGVRHGVPEPHCIHSDEYREEAEALVRLAMDVERGIWPEWYLDFCGIDTRLSPILKDFAGLDEMDPKGCADIVRMDHPAELWMALTQYTVTEGIAVAPQYKGIRFLERAVDPLTEYSEMLSPAMHRAFEVKYYFGFARPEEYFESPNFSHYPEGCPAHPSYIAGHGTAELMKPVTTNHTVVSGVTKVTHNTQKPATNTVQVPRKRTFANAGNRGCKSCGRS